MVDTSEASATVAGSGDRIRTSGDSEVSTYLEIAEAREPGHLLTPAPEAPEAIVVLDYGSQFSMLITRRIREAGVYAELAPWDTPSEKLSHLKVKGFVLSGGPASVYDEGAPTLAPYVVASGSRCSASATGCSCWRSRSAGASPRPRGASTGTP